MRKNLSLPALRAVLMVLLIAFGVGNAWAGHGGPHYGKAVVAVASGSTGSGTVYMGSKGTTSQTWDCGNSGDGDSKSYSCTCEGWGDGYYFAGWNKSNTTAGSYSSTSATASLSFGSASGSSSPSEHYYYAWILGVEPTAASGDVSFNVDNLSTTYTKTVSFTQTGGDNQNDFNNATISLKSGGGTWAHKSTTYNSSTKKVDVQFTYTAGRSTWTNAAGTRTDKVTLTLSSKGNKSYSVDVTANLPAVTVSAGTGSSVAMNHAADTQTGSVTFPVTSVDGKTDLNEPTITKTSGEGTWAITGYSYANGVVIVNYSHTGSGTYGTRASAATITLSAKAGESSNTCNVTATYPSLTIDGADDSGAYTPSLETDGPGVATFNVSYADGLSDFTIPTEVTEPEGGTWTVGEATYTKSATDVAKGTVTIDYTYNSGGYVGERTAKLTLTASNAATNTLTLHGVTEPEATDDAVVIAADGVTEIYKGDWVTALSKANLAANAGCTLQLLRSFNITTGNGQTATQGVTNTFTLDLNGKTLSASINGPVLNPKTAGKILTIKDSKTGGKIENITPNYNGVTYGVNISAGDVVLESGTIHAENNAVFNHSSLASLGTRAVKLAANTKFTMSGGTLEAKGGREVYGIYQESSSANNTADKSVVTISGGTIKAEAPALVYGIRSYGKVNMSGGTIDVTVNTEAVNSNTSYVAANFNDNTLHRYGYGIRMYATSSATLASNYFGTLTMTGGTINVTNLNKTMNGTTLYNEHIYGVKMEVSPTGAGAGKTAPDGTKVMKACAIGSIENATITLTHTGVLGYGVIATGCYNSVDNKTTPLQIKNSTINVTTFQTAYGVYADAYVNWNSTLTKLTGNGGCTYGNIELTNTTINATTTGGTGAYCGWAACTSGTVANAKATTGSTSEGNGTYYGEYAAAGKIVVNSGTYTASAATSSAYGFGSSDRAKCVRNVNGVFSGRDAATDSQGSLSDNTPTSEAYPELYIHGGDISATTGTSTTAIAVKSGGNTVIDGGTFNAYSGAGTAYGLYVTAGKTTASGVTFPASATTVAYGVYVYGGISDWSLFPYAGEVELNNCNVTATARTTTNARAVFVEGVTKVYTQASFDAMKSANNSNYQTYGDYAQVGERAIIGKATINGGTYTATAETTYAYGIVVAGTKVSTNKEAIASGALVVKNATVTAKTNTSTNAYGVQPGGGALIENCTISATSGTTTASGVRAVDKTTIIKNSTITAKGTDAVYGLEGYVEISGTHGYCWHGEFDLTEAGTTKVTAESTASSKPAYAIYLKATNKNIASGNFAGDYAIAANATINEGTYIAKINGGTSGYALALDGQKTQGNVVTQPEVLITGGMFNGATAEVGTAGIVGHVQLKGGCYVHNTNLAKYIPEGYEEFPLPSDRQEYTEGYRYAIEEAGNHGIDVCQIGSKKYKSLEEALQAATSGNTILMIANYTLPAGDWILKSGVKLLVPYSGQTTTKEESLEVVEITSSVPLVTPSQNLRLSFAEGAHLVCNGIIEVGAKQAGQGSSELTGQVQGSYGHICLAEGSSITIESGASLFAWGYVTGKGEITIKNGGKSYEMFQFGWYKGGNTTSEIYYARSNYKIFPMTDYSYQNIECPITYYPGASAYGKSAVKPSSYQPMQKPLAMLVGTADNCMFKMTTAEASANTWVKKVYDPETDITNWIMNSGASISGISMNVGVTVNSADFYLPITSNFRITLNYGDMNINNDVIFLPGSQLIINKEATGILKSGKLLFFYDAEDWFTGLGHVSVQASGWSKAKTCGYYYYPATYSPTWGTANPRKNVYARDKASIDKNITPLPDAELFVHGKMIVNGSLYTSGDGNASSIGRNANIHSTNEDAGKIQFNTKVTGSMALYKVCFAIGSSEANNSWSDMIYGGQTTAYPAHLTNGDGTYVQSSGTEAGKQYVYVDNQWQCWEEIGCYTYDAQNHPYAKPAAYVQLTSDQPDANHLLHDAATGNRNFVWDQNCYWWEVVTTPTAEGYYKSINADYNGKYNYYYYDSDAGCWKIKIITVTWNINGSTTNYSVGYGTKPEWYGGTPSKSSSSSNYYYIWDGWTAPGSETLIANSELPEVTADITFTAHFYEKYYQYNIIFKNDDGTVLESKNWNSGSTPSYEGTPTKAATYAQTFEFNGTWNPAIETVSKAATYVAQYTATTRQYDVTFLNYDMSVLGTTKVDYNTTPTSATYKAAIAPSDYEPYKPDNNAYSFEFDGWRLNGASSNGFSQVKGDQTYVAQFAETTKKYRITFVDEDGETVLHWTQLEYDAMPSYDGPATSGFNKQDVEWLYEFTGWTPAAFTAVKGPQTYTATYNKTHREYQITWIDGDGNTLTTTNVEYGTTPTYPGTPTPTKASTNTINYTFNNTWSPALVPVTGEATYTAQFDESERTYALTIGVNDAEFGSVDPASVTGIPYNAAVTVNNNTFTVNGTTVTATQKTNTAQYTYAFSSWTNVPNMVTADVSNIQAVFTRTLNTYTVTFNDYNGAELKKQTVDWNTAATAPSNPSREGYTFTGWDKAFSAVTADLVVTAQYSVKQYTITFDSEGGSAVASITQDYESPVTPPANPTRTGYTFANWSPEVPSTMPLNGTTCVAQWTPNTNTAYTVKHYKQNLDGTYPSTPTETDNLTGTTGESVTPDRRSYEGFDAPAGETVTILADGSRVVTYNYTRKSYNLSWVTDGDALTGSYTHGETKFGATITAPNTPTKTGYTFNGWTPEKAETMPAAATTYTATWTANTNTAYAVEHYWQNIADNEYTKHETVNMTGTTDAATVAVAESYTGFEAQSFSQGTIAPDGSTVVKIYYNRETYLIKWEVKLNGEQEAYKEETLRYGAMPSYGSTPTKEQSESQVFTFSGWTPTPYAVDKDQTYNGSFNVSPRPYTITFVNDNGEELWHSDFGWGSTPSYGGSTPVSSHTGDGYAYEHTGWKPAVAAVTGTATYTAVYSRSADAIVVNTPETVVNNTIAPTTTVENHGTLTIGDTENDVTLRTNVTVVENGGELVVSNGSSIGKEDPSEESIIIVESGGQLNVEESGSIEADVFIIQATTEEQGEPEALEEVQVSGELSETGSKNVSAIYYDLTRKHGTENFLARVWYAVAVPWAVEVPTYADGGVYIKRGDDYVPQRLGATFDLLSYDGACRATNGASANCWVYLEDEIDGGADAVMVPGKLYMIYLTEETSTIRFKKKAGEAIHTNTLTVSAHSETSNANDANWNGIANPTTYRAYMNVNVGEGGLVQKFVPGTQPRDGGSYLPLDLDDKQAVGQPFFVQVDPTAGTSVVVTRTNPSAAPRRAKAEQDQEARYAIGLAANGKLADRLYIQTAEEKEDRYVIGKDMSKMGVSSYVAQMWVERYNSKLCLNTMTLTRDIANYPLGISAPQAGEYKIFAPADITTGDNIYLTFNGRVIWNLTMAPYYASLEKGTTTSYGLRIVHFNTPAVTTGVDDVRSENTRCMKVVMDDHVYILRGEELYTVTGQKAK